MSESPGKPQNTGVGSLPRLQGIFLTQKQNGDLCIAGGFFTSWATREACWSKEVVNIRNHTVTSQNGDLPLNFFLKMLQMF